MGNQLDTESDYAARYYTAHGSAHYYLKRGLADPSVTDLTPWCQVGKLVPETHPHWAVGNRPLSRDTRFQICAGCRDELRLTRTGRLW